MSFQFLAYHPITRAQLAPRLKPIECKSSQTVNGNGVLEMKLAVPQSKSKIDQLKLVAAEDESAIYVKNKNNQFTWGGVVVDQGWSPDERTITITAIEWRAWLFSVFLEPFIDGSGNLSDIAYSWTNQDQLIIARGIMQGMMSCVPTALRPTVIYGSELSGKNRDLNVTGLQFKKAGELLDTMARRSGGFEWDLVPRPNSTDGLPELVFTTYYPQQGSLVSGLLLKKTPQGGNLLKYGPVSRSSGERRTRVWATGAGQPPDQEFAQDTDPSGALKVYRSSVTNYNSVTDRTTLASHARAERLFYSTPTALLDVQVSSRKPDVDIYGKGDRGRLILQDDWVDYDLPAVRVISRTIDYVKQTADLTLDLSDYELPTVDTGGTV